MYLGHFLFGLTKTDPKGGALVALPCMGILVCAAGSGMVFKVLGP